MKINIKETNLSKSKGKIPKWLLIVGGLLVLFIIIVAVGGGKKKPAVSPTSEGREVSKEKPAPSREEIKEKPPPRVKKRAIIKTANSRFSFEINGIKTADRLIHDYAVDESPYVWPHKGYKFIVINATLKNIGIRKESNLFIDPRLLVVNKGYKYESSGYGDYVGEYGQVREIFKDLRPTESATETFAYEILENTVPAKLIIGSWRGRVFSKKTVMDLTPYKVGKIEYKPAKASIIDYKVEYYYYPEGKDIRISDIYLIVKSKGKIPAIIKSVEVSVAKFQGKGTFYDKGVRLVSPNKEEELFPGFSWEGPRLAGKRYPLIKLGVHTITFKILGLEGEVLATKSFSHHFKAE